MNLNKYITVFVVLFFLFQNQSVSALNKKYLPDYRTVIEHAENYLKNQHTIKDIGSLFLKERALPGSVLASDIPHQDAFSRLFHQNYRINNIAIKRLVNSDEDVRNIVQKNNSKFANYFYSFSPDIQKTLVHAYDDVLIKALYCDETRYDNLDLKILLSMRDFKGGYADTHGLLGLFFLEGNQCVDNHLIIQYKNNIIESIIQALEKDNEYSDLYAERVACLFWAGAGEKVKPEWMRCIISAQRADGGWGDKGMPSSSVHPTGLSLLAIRYYFTDFERYFYCKNKHY